MRHTDLIPLLALLSVDGVGDVTTKRLLSTFGDAASVFKAKPRQLSAVCRIPQLARRLKSPTLFHRAEKELKFIETHKIKSWFYQDDDYPNNLKHCPDGPVLLFGSGKIDFAGRRLISVVGTRKVTAQGIETCQKLIADLAPLNPVIVSGLAYGTDIVAHLAALESGLPTIGVVAHGLDMLYPASHKRYLQRISENGGLMTEFTSGTAPLPENFVRRNRIVAGLSDATVVIESAEKGGSLITAQMAHSYDREVFAVPGRPQDKMSQGCLQLVKADRARLLTTAADLVYHLNWEVKPKAVQRQLFVDLQPEEKEVRDYLVRSGRQLLDIIAVDCSIPVFKLSAVLLAMELKGAVRPLPGKWFEAI